MWVAVTVYLSGGQELHPTSHLEAVANEIFYGQRCFPQVLHWEREREDERQREPLTGLKQLDNAVDPVDLTFLQSGTLGGRVTQRGLVIDVSGGRRRGGPGSPPVHLARLNHPSHLALSSWRAVLSAEAINIQHVWEQKLTMCLRQRWQEENSPLTAAK